jgi:hypothetical protein
MTKYGEDRGKKAFCVLEFAKTESVVTVQLRFRTKYHTEPPMDKTIHERCKKFQQSGCLCATQWTGQLGPSAETVEHVQPVSFRVKTFAQNALYTWLRDLQFCAISWLLRAPDKSFLHMLDSLGWWPWLVSTFYSAQAAILLEFLVPLMKCFVHRLFYVVLGPKPLLHHHN